VNKFAVPETGQVDHFEKLERGLTLVLRIGNGGTKAWRVHYYVNGKPRAKTLGRFPAMTVAAARKAAYAFDPTKANAAAEAGSFKAVAESWILHYVDHKKLRTKAQIERVLKVYIYPEFEKKQFFEIRRGDVNTLLDKVVRKHGASQADQVLAVVRGLMGWFQTRDENYVSPVVKGMKRDQRKASERARNRILNDEEIRAVWKASGEMGTYGALVKLLLLTAQREAKVQNMKWQDVSDGIWTIQTDEREKGNAGQFKLPQMAVDIIEAQPRIAGNDHVLASTLTSDPTNGLSKFKKALNKKLADMPNWTLHDLRRTARSLMARAGVADNIAERTLGHTIRGVEGVYNRHDYFEEKSDALKRLATMVETILNPPTETNVVRLGR
jgi:integrase